MVKSPVQIIIELLVGLISGLVEDLEFINAKMVELFISLGFLARTNPLGAVIAVVSGSLVLFFTLKYASGYVKIIIILSVILVFLLLLVGLAFTITTPVATETVGK